MGSKSRVAHEIVPIIQGYIDETGSDTYIEPFCGGCNIIEHILAPRKIAGDKQKYLIALLQNLHRLTELPESLSREHYREVRNCYNNGDGVFDDWYIGAIGFLGSYNGRFFDGGYAGIVRTKHGVERDYYNEAKQNLEQQASKLTGIDYVCADYDSFSDVCNCVIYCDPPYIGTKQYGISKRFNHEKFWRWVRKMSQNNIVLVSECSAPDDFVCIWERSITRTIDNNKRKQSSEKLFMFGGDKN